MKKSYKERVFDDVVERGYTIVSSRDSFVHKKRNTLNELVMEGRLKIYYVSPSYDGYSLV